MATTHFVRDAERLLADVHRLLDSPNGRDRIRAARHLSLGIWELERKVVWSARDQAMTWAAIGEVYGVSRQAAQQRFGGP
jgi:hypothetical protein